MARLSDERDGDDLNCRRGLRGDKVDAAEGREGGAAT
jgi:hypothetical protein